MTTLAEALELALTHHQAGRLAEATIIYQKILEVDPQQADSLYLLGRIAHQSGRWDDAVDLLKRAMRADPAEPTFAHALAEALRAQGRLSDSLVWYATAIRLKPDYAVAHCNFGTALSEAGDARAEALFREALRLNPGFAECHNNLGMFLRGCGRTAEAQDCYEEAVRLNPAFAEAFNNLGNVLREQEDEGAAISAYRHALAVHPKYSLAHLNLAKALKDAGRLAEAVEELQQALVAQPDDCEMHAVLAEMLAAQENIEQATDHYDRALAINSASVPTLISYAALLHQQAAFADAERCLHQALEIEPQSVRAHINLGYTFQAQGKLSQAIRCFEQALRRDPNNVEAENSLAVVWIQRDRPDKALEHCRRAVERDARFAFGHNNLGICLQQLGQQAPALAAYRRAIELSPSSPGLHSNLLSAMHCLPCFDAATIAKEHRAWGERHADPLMPNNVPHAASRIANRRLRVGYVSPFFREHAVNTFVEPILATHDHRAFEVFCYSDVAAPDATTQRLTACADHWRTIFGLSDQNVCAAIRRDQIDILIDLSGHIGGNRLLVFARKPAPVQVTYIGYQNTTGMAAMDYRVTDDYADPLGKTDAYYTETLVRLPGSFFCYRPSSDAPPVAASPFDSNGHITFGSFNNFAKVTPELLATWADVLVAVPRSRLIVLAFDIPIVREYLDAAFERRGIDAGRVEVANRGPYQKYLELISRVDVALDSFPFNGHTTTCDCLWMGVPVVLLAGETYVSRYGGRALVSLQLDDLIASAPDEYVQIAARLAANPQRLKELRATLRARMQASPLLDYETFTRNLEDAYRKVWATWCAQ